VPTVKEVSVLKRHRNKSTTSWHIKVENDPIRWTEEDTIQLQENLILFKAIDGDLEQFNGEWRFNDHSHGTEVVVTINLKINIPVIKDFAQDFINRLVTKNFESILESIEQRLVSVRYESYKKGDLEKIAGFGIVGHFFNFKHFESYLKSQDPSVKIPSQEFIGQLFHRIPSFKVFDILDFKSKTGKKVQGCFILATFFPDMIGQDSWAVFSKVVKAGKIAEKHGMGIIGLGGFAAIVGEKIDHEVSDELDIPVTSGRTFTAAIVIDAVTNAAEMLKMDIGLSKIAVIGGAGEIGSAVSRVFADKAKQLSLCGRTKPALDNISSELKKIRKAQISVTINSNDAVKDADIVIAAASSASSFLDISWFKPGSIVCDVGYPKNVSYLSEARDDIFLFDGGLSKSPTPLSLPINVGLPSPDVMYGCFAESIILDLENRYENFTSRKSKITPEKIEEIRLLGKKHGFVASDFYRNGKIVNLEVVEKLKTMRIA
jgi:predicted amino acid dehydrogenase/ribosome-associated toxin RatA of RatAB toxin-antitoxin module